MTLKEPKVTLWRYEMDIRPKDRGPSGNPRELAKAKQKRYIQLLLNEKMGNVTYATDYAKILVTTTKLSWVKDQGDEFDVVYNDPLERPLPVRTNNEDPKISEARRVRTKQVHVKPNGSFLLSDFLANIVSSGTTGYYASREDVIQFLNIIFNKPAQSDPLVTTVGQKRFFPFSGRTHNLPGHRLMEEWDLSEGLKALRGYYTSVRVGPSRLFVNVNVSTAAFFKEGSLMDLIDEFIGPDRSESGMRKLQVFLKGLKVKTNYLQEKDANGKMQKVTKVRTIFGLAKAPRLGANSKQAMTTWKDAGPNEGKKMSVAEYFFKSGLSIA